MSAERQDFVYADNALLERLAWVLALVLVVIASDFTIVNLLDRTHPRGSHLAAQFFVREMQNHQTEHSAYLGQRVSHQLHVLQRPGNQCFASEWNTSSGQKNGDDAANVRMVPAYLGEGNDDGGCNDSAGNRDRQYGHYFFLLASDAAAAPIKPPTRAPIGPPHAAPIAAPPTSPRVTALSDPPVLLNRPSAPLDEPCFEAGRWFFGGCELLGGVGMGKGYHGGAA